MHLADYGMNIGFVMYKRSQKGKEKELRSKAADYISLWNEELVELKNVFDYEKEAESIPFVSCQGLFGDDIYLSDEDR